MAAVPGHDSRQYSWLWVSHISPKNSKWLQENLSDMDTRVKAMIKLINEDADSFARRAEMYYKKRPELMKQVEEFYRAYRALAERYDQATGALRQAHKTISEAFPNQMPSMSDELSSSSGQEVEPHTPEMPVFSRAQFDSDDHYISKRNGTQSEESSALSNRKSLKQSNDSSPNGENAPRAIFDGKARKGLNFVSPEVKGKEDISSETVNFQQEISKLLAESQNLKQQMLSESERANKAETEIQSLKDTILQLNSEKGTSLLQYDQSTERLSTLESELSRAQADLKKLTNEMASEVQKLNSAESCNSVIQSELKSLDEKAKMQQQELEQKVKELENVHLSFQVEHEKRMHAENAIISEGKERAQSQEEVQRLTMDIKLANEKLNELMQSKVDLENTVCELKKEVSGLTEQNRNLELLIQELHDEINLLRDSKNELLSEIQGLRSTISQLKVEKEGALLQHQQSVERVSYLESQLLNLQSELEVNEKKVQMLTQDLKQKRDEVDNVCVQLQDECHRSAQTQAALLSTESLHSQLEEEMKRLTQDLDVSTKKLSELENDRLDLENTSKVLKNTISDLNCAKDAALLQQQRSLEKVSDLESQLSKTQLDLEKSEQKMQILELEMAQKSESVNSLELSLKDEAERRVQAETSLMSLENMYSQSQEEVSRLLLGIEKLNDKLNELENSSSELKNTILLLNTEKDAILLKNQQSSTRVSDLESELSKLQAELEKVEGEVQVMEQELKYKQEEVGTLQTSLRDEAQKRNEGEATLLAVTNLHSESQEEVNRLALEIEKLTGKLSQVENSKMDLGNIVSKHIEEIHLLREQNICSGRKMKDLYCELDALRELNVKLETELGFHIGEKENLEETYHALADEMDDLKTSAGTKQKLIEELQLTNLKLKEVSANNLIEKALLSEKVQEMEKLSEEYSLLENSVSDANAEMEALREKIKVLDSSESSLKDEVSSHVSEKAVLALELETLGKSFADISEKSSMLEISLSDMKAGLEYLRIKLKDSEETCQAQLADNLVLCVEKNNLVSQLENITVAMKALEGKHANLEGKHTSLSREKDLTYNQVRELQGLLTGRNEEYDVAVKSHEMHANNLEEQISSLQEKFHDISERLEQEEQKSMGTSIAVMVLENSLDDVKDKSDALFNECQKYAEANNSAEILISQLKDESRYHNDERKTLLKHNERLREGISQHLKVLNIYKDLGPADIAQDEILLQTISDEIFNILKLKEETEDVNRVMHTELSVLAAVLLEIGLEFRDMHLQKSALEKKVESGAEDLLSLQNKNHQIQEWNEQLKNGLQKGSEREEVLKTEVSCLRESYQTSQDVIIHLSEKNESLSNDHLSLIEKYNALEDENSTILVECMMLEHLSLFSRGHNNEVASALVSLTGDMALLSLVKGELDSEVQVLSAKAMMLMTENSHLKDYFIYLVEVLSTRIAILDFDLNTWKSVCQELSVELESCMSQLMLKDDELMEAEEKVQFMQGKNQELCGVVGALQVAVEGAKVVKAELEKKVMTLTEEGTTKDDEILLVRQANETLQVKAEILKEEKDSLASTHKLMLKDVEQQEREFAMLAGDAIISSVNAAVYEEKALKVMMEGKDFEINAIAQKELILKEISARDSRIEAIQKKVTVMQEENDELNAKLSTHLALVASLSDHVDVLEEGTLSPAKSCGCNTEDKEVAAHVPSTREGNHGPESHQFPGGTPELHQLIRRIEALQVVILNAKDHQDQESTNNAAKLATANIEIQGLRARGSSRMDAKEIYSDNEKQKDAEGSKGKQVQMMKDIELDQLSTCPPYGTGAALYPTGNGEHAELDDEVLQLWEAAEKSCKNQTAKSSSSEHDIQAVEEAKSEYPSSELARGRDFGINKLEMSSASVLEPQEVWGKNVIERLTSDAQRLRSIQASIEELKQKTGGSSKGKSPMNSEYDSVSAQLHETEGFVLEQINLNSKMAKKAENDLALSDSMNAEREGYPSRRKISEQVQRGSENVGRLELELQKIQYVLLKLEEEQEYRMLRVSDKRTRVLLRDYLYGRKDHRGGAHKKKRTPFCGCVGAKSRTEP